MLLCYQVATPDVTVSPSVTAYQGNMDEVFSVLAAIGYDGVELMTLEPKKLQWDHVKATAQKYGLLIPLVCTGEVFGQLGLSFTDPSEDIREEAIKRVCEIIDFAAYLGANINIGRIRGQYRDDVRSQDTYEWAIDAFKRISIHGAKSNVQIALESITILQTNFINTVAESVDIVNRVAMDNFKIMMDVFHMNIEEKNVIETIQLYKDYNIHVHLADNNRRYPGHCGMDYEKIIREFYNVGYDGAFCTEIYQIPDQKTAADRAMQRLAPIFKEIYGRK